MQFVPSCGRKQLTWSLVIHFNGASWRRESGPQQQLDRQYTRRDIQERQAPSATQPLTLVGAPGDSRRVVGRVRLRESIQVAVGRADTLSWCLRNEPSIPRLVDEGPDLPPRSLDSPFERSCWKNSTQRVTCGTTGRTTNCFRRVLQTHWVSANQCHLLQRPYHLPNLKTPLMHQYRGTHLAIGTKDGHTTMRGLLRLCKLLHRLLLVDAQ